MKQKILGIIMLVVMAFSVLALSSWEGLFPGGEVTDNHFKNVDMPLVYEIYLDYMEDIGEEPLSYDEWFEAIHGDEFQEGIIPLIEKNENSGFWEISFNNGKGWNDLQFKTENEEQKKCKHTFGKWVTISEGNDYFNGIRYRECKKCDYKDYQFKIDKDAPSHTHSFTTTTTDPTCEAGGFDTKTCSCGYTEKVNETAPLGHEYTNEYVSDATYHWKKCVRCDYTTAKEEHTRGEGDKCSVCGVEMAHTHKFTTTTTAPSCEAGGFDTKTCSCGYTEKVNKTAPLGHEYTDEYVSDATYHWKKCVRCDYTTAKEEHTAGDDGKCATCKREICTSNEYFIFTLLDDGTYSIKAKDVNIMPNNVVIPSVHNGMPVTSIGNFAHCQNLINVIMPDSIINIELGAFGDCDNLIGIEIPDKVEVIANYLFSGCDNLSWISIGAGVTAIGYNAFDGCNNLANITVNENNIYYKSIEGNLYSKDGKTFVYYARGKKHTTFAIPNGVTSLSYDAFKYSPTLTSIVIPESVSSFDSQTFAYCYDLTNIYVDENNQYYKSIDGNLYSKDGTTLLMYAIGKKDISFEIPNNVTSIGEYAFAGCNSLANIIIPDSIIYISDFAFCLCTSLANVKLPDKVTTIGYSAFNGCKSLTSVVIPNSITYIDYWAFYNCDNLFVIYNHSNLLFEIGSDNCGYIAKNAKVITSNDTVIYANDGFEYILSDENYLFRVRNNVYTLIAYTGGEETVTLPESIYGNTYDFYNMRGVINVIIPDIFTYICDFAFYDCDSLKSITMGDGITSIGNLAFAECSNLTDIVLKNCITIGYNTFRNCISLNSIKIPASVTSIGQCTFEDCDNLTTIDVDENNQYYKSIDGNLYSKEGTTLVQYAIGKKNTTFEIPHSVTSINSYAFSGCDTLTVIIIPKSITAIDALAFSNLNSLTSIAIPDSTTYIGEYAFEGCENLISVIIPNSVTTIRYCVFSSCKNLTDVYYTGTEEEWAAITIEDGNQWLTNATIHFNYVPEE